ncbi:MAG: HipA N-terminal domain-containing protein [Bacteroidales bacterium]|nr:HipA N-terminal domain-containing protein [Bacteroidales bacterium]MBQ9194301.1 HipA N-terminal domain-containing protein [Bacteroidales bacterium]
MRQLAVYQNHFLAGILTERNPGRGYVFEYDRNYLASGGNPISVTLPLRSEPFEADALFPFFENMIPEGANRRLFCRSRRIDENDYFGILSALAGKDVIGSVSLRQVEE